MSPKALAIIPARGGSKRIPRKNIRPFLGKPIIQYSIETARQSGCFDIVMVSTDDAEIAEVAMSCGAETPFQRSQANANDYAMLPDVILEVLSEYEQRGQTFDYFCCILATAPFVQAAWLSDAFAKLQQNDADCVMPLVRFGYPIQRALRMQNGQISMMWPEHLNSRSNDLEPGYHDSGLFYWMQTERFLAQKKIFAEKTIGIELPESQVQDIDSEEDWRIAEMKYQILYPQAIANR